MPKTAKLSIDVECSGEAPHQPDLSKEDLGAKIPYEITAVERQCEPIES
jgi:hypothetical protein